jgi:hypothetical protein|tara:strand:- start:557 stop:730 length:174 start_codon:yes stop_codon:yes gene_type:complete
MTAFTISHQQTLALQMTYNSLANCCHQCSELTGGRRVNAVKPQLSNVFFFVGFINEE